jgi:hypothetical protein
MAMTHESVYPQTPQNAVVTIVPGDTTTKKTVLTAGANGAKVGYISVTSDDTSDRTLAIYVNDGGATDGLIGEVLIPDGAGTNGTDKAVSLLNATSLPFLPADLTLTLKAGAILKVAAKVAVTSGKTIYVTAFYGDY